MPKSDSSRLHLLPSFGRRQGRKLTRYKQKLIAEELPKLRLDANMASCSKVASDLVSGAKELWLEIGFGAGEHLAALAERYPEIGFIGGEPYINGVAKLLENISKKCLSNIRIVPDDIRPVMEALPPCSLHRIYILFPDPWRKSRHYKRRIINHTLLDHAARLLPVGGILQLATDHRDYSAWMLEHLLMRQDFKWKVSSYADWCLPSDDWVTTKYELKTRNEGREPVYLTFIRQ